MALVIVDRARDTSATTGTSDFSLDEATPTGFVAWSTVGNGNTSYYVAVNSDGDWEIGIGTYNSTGPVWERTTILQSSNAGSKVNFGAGTKQLFSTLPADRTVGTQTFFMPASGMYAPAANAASEGTMDGVPTWDFDDGADENVEFIVGLPKHWDLDTITAIYFWGADDVAGAKDVEWNIQAVSLGNDDPIDTAMGTAVAVTDTNGSAAEDVMISAETGAITLANTPAAEQLARVQIHLDVSDSDLSGDAKLLGVLIKYGQETLTDD